MLAVFVFSLLVSSTGSGVRAEPASSKGVRTARAAEHGEWSAPDGRPGFGSGRNRRDIERLVRSPDAWQREFVGALAEQISEVELELALAHARYEAQGYYEVLGLEQPTPEKLGARF